jgi:4-hydroxy-2-oxoglutarate aldolase
LTPRDLPVENDAVNLAGIFPPVATPFTADGELDLDALRFNVGRWAGTGLRGLVLLGTNGESAFVDDDEADRIVGAARERLPRDRELIVGTGRESTRATIEACRRAAALGATAVLVRAPAFFKGQMDTAAFVRHFTAVADASPAPVLLYNFPQAFGVNVAMPAIERLAQHPNIGGMKESSGDIGQIADEVSRTPDRFVVVVGSAPTLYASLCVGATGGVVALANVVPDLCVRLYELWAAGRSADALQLQRALTPLARLVTAVHGVAGLKAAMTLAGYRGGAPRLPLAPAGDGCVVEIRRAIQTLASATNTTVEAASSA